MTVWCGVEACEVKNVLFFQTQGSGFLLCTGIFCLWHRQVYHTNSFTHAHTRKRKIKLVAADWFGWVGRCRCFDGFSYSSIEINYSAEVCAVAGLMMLVVHKSNSATEPLQERGYTHRGGGTLTLAFILHRTTPNLDIARQSGASNTFRTPNKALHFETEKQADN